jgi:transposase InsO family protein
LPALGFCSPTHELRTIPSKTDEVTFVVYGDSRGHPEHHRMLVERMIRVQPDFVIHTGELFSRIDEMKYVVERWQMDYNHHRPHSSLGYVTSAGLAGLCQQAASVRDRWSTG